MTKTRTMTLIDNGLEIPSPEECRDLLERGGIGRPEFLSGRRIA